MTTPSTVASQTDLLPEQPKHPSGPSQENNKNGEPKEETFTHEKEHLTKKQKAKHYTHNILDAIVKAGTGGGMGP
ncbi:hypothetical protein DPSP01_000673 [Paraphaeosphaeria sporulosa]